LSEITTRRTTKNRTEKYISHTTHGSARVRGGERMLKKKEAANQQVETRKIGGTLINYPNSIRLRLINLKYRE
jgi:hypothetical protein